MPRHADRIHVDTSSQLYSLVMRQTRDRVLGLAGVVWKAQLEDVPTKLTLVNLLAHLQKLDVVFLDSQRRALLSQIVNCINDTASKTYVGNQRCRRLAAPRGSGKSELLRVLVDVLPSFVKSIVVYADSREVEFRLLDIVSKILQSYGPVAPTWEGVRAALRRHDVCLVVFFDEVEKHH
jgi:hypothetical protein